MILIGFEGDLALDEYYQIYTMGDFPPDDNDLDVSQNTRRIHSFSITARPIVMPYKDTMRWTYYHVDVKTQKLASEEEFVIA